VTEYLRRKLRRLEGVGSNRLEEGMKINQCIRMTRYNSCGFNIVQDSINVII
jgi:hypothetical protein